MVGARRPGRFGEWGAWDTSVITPQFASAAPPAYSVAQQQADTIAQSKHKYSHPAVQQRPSASFSHMLASAANDADESADASAAKPAKQNSKDDRKTNDASGAAVSANQVYPAFRRNH